MASPKSRQFQADSNVNKMVDANSKVISKDKGLDSSKRKIAHNLEETITANSILGKKSAKDLDREYNTSGAETPISGDAVSRSKAGSKPALYKG